MKKIRIQLKSKKNQEELIQQNFFQELEWQLSVLSALNALKTLAATSIKSLTTANNEKIKQTINIIMFLFSIDICFSRTFSTSYLQPNKIYHDDHLKRL